MRRFSLYATDREDLRKGPVKLTDTNLGREMANDNKKPGQVEVILESEGIVAGVSGRFGTVPVYQEKKKKTQNWLTDERPSVRRKISTNADRSLMRAI